ncbi:hypothetical protein GCM10028820_07330 [Tessaracoccus terricola]
MTDERHLDDEELLDVALGAGDGTETAHLADCPECHERYRELDAGVRSMLAAAPSVAPPAGFSGRVLAARAPRARSRRATLLAAAAAVVLGLAAGVGGTLLLTRDGPPATAPRADAVSTLVTGGGDVVGTAALTDLSGRPYVMLSISSGRPGASYDCVLVDAAGGRTHGGSWTLGDGYGSSRGAGVWMVPVEGEPPVGVELGSGPDQVWARADF